MSTTKRIAAALLLVGIASSASAATPSDSSVSNDGWTDFGTGMEYKFMSTQVNYDDALASCSSIGPEHTLASPFTAEQAALLVGFAPATAFIGLKNKLEGQPKPCRDFAEFEWESGAVRCLPFLWLESPLNPRLGNHHSCSLAENPQCFPIL